MTPSRRTALVAKLFLFFLISTLGMAGLLPSAARAEARAPTTPRTAVVEVNRLQEGKIQKLMRFTVVLTEGERPARLSLRQGGTSYNLKLRCGRAQAGMVTVNLDIRWVDGTRGKGKQRVVSHNEVAMTSRIALGRRVLLGKVERADSSELQVSVTLK